MSSPPPPESSFSPEELSRNLFRLLLAFATAAPSQPNQTSPENMAGPTQPMIMIFRSSDIEAFFNDLSNKNGPLPASKAAIDAMPVVKVTAEGVECAICLTEFEVDGEAKEMPCKHRYHSGCIDKWLGIHGSCPVCRHKMPEGAVGDEKRSGGGGGGGGEGGRGGRVGGDIWIIIRGDGSSRQGQDMEIDSN